MDPTPGPPDQHDTTQVIKWNTTTRELEVLDEGRLVESVLPNYFKSNNIITFQRQLNYYGFSKIFRGTQTLPIYRNDDPAVATVEDVRSLPRRVVKRANQAPRARFARAEDAAQRGLPLHGATGAAPSSAQ